MACFTIRTVLFKTPYFLAVCCSAFNSFTVKKKFGKCKTTKNAIISRLIYFKKNSLTVFKILSEQTRRKDFFLKYIFFKRIWNFFGECTTTNIGVFFSNKKLIFFHFILFFQVLLFNFNIIFATCLKNLLKKLEKKMVTLLF